VTPGEFWRRAAAWVRRRDLERELASELDAHAESLARDLEHDGMSAADARAEARRQVGSGLRAREASRDAWGFPAFDALLHDLRYAVRGLRRSPGFTATVVVTLALGIGANTTMFSIIDRLMFRPYPYMRAPSEVHRVYLRTTGRGRTFTYATMPYTRYLDIARASRSFSQITAVSEWRLAVGTGQNTHIRHVDGVSASFFALFDAPPVRGRYFNSAEDEAPNGTRVAVLAYPLWQSEFGGRDVVGESLQIGLAKYTVIGVAPKGFVGTANNGAEPDLFVPITTIPANVNPVAAANYLTTYTWDWTEIIVRRRAGVSDAASAADLTNAFIQSRNAQRPLNPRMTPDSLARPRALEGSLRSWAAPDAGLESRVLLWVAGVAAIVLLIACANVANLMFARVLRRRREIAVRLALGVSRQRLVAQFVVEGALLAVIGCAAGLLAAQWAGVAVQRLLFLQVTGPDGGLIADWRTIGAAAACACVSALLVAVGPAILATRSDLAGSLKSGARAGVTQHSRLRSTLLVAQGALSVVLLIGAALFVRSLTRVVSIPLGYDANNVVETIFDFRGLQMDSATGVAVRRRLLDAAKAIPGVESAARVNSHLYSTNTAYLSVPGIDSIARLGRFNYQMSTPDYFSVMRTRIVRGRAFNASDGAGAPLVAVVSQAMGRALWPNQDPIGQCIHVAWDALHPETRPPCSTVVGVAEDAAMQTVTDEERYIYYIPVDQANPGWATTILVRVSPSVTDGPERVRRALQSAMPGDGFVIVRPLAELVDISRRSWHLGAVLFTTFGLLALVVATVGLYGVIAYDVAQRRHEIGVRIALGARSRDVLAIVARQGFGFVAAAVGLGVLVALAAARWIQPLLYGESAKDPVAYAVVSAIMIVVALVASVVPAARAARVDPNIALRAE
jgi:putative ABC transport system permease protein